MPLMEGGVDDAVREFERRIQEIAADGDRLAAAIRDVIYQGRRAERKLWREYRGDDPLNPDIMDDTESFAEGEALHHALNDLEELIASCRS